MSSLADEQRADSLHVCCSLRSLRLAVVSRCLPYSLRSLVQDSGAPAWRSTAARDPVRATTTAADSRDVRAADLQEEMTEQRFSVPSAPTKMAAT